MIPTPRKSRRSTRKPIRAYVKSTSKNKDIGFKKFEKIQKRATRFSLTSKLRKHKVIRYNAKIKRSKQIAIILRSKKPRISMRIRKVSSGI